VIANYQIAVHVEININMLVKYKSVAAESIFLKKYNQALSNVSTVSTYLN